MTGFLDDGFTRYRLTSVLFVLTIAGLLLGLWKVNNPTVHPPQLPEGWDYVRVIMSRQALDIIGSPEIIRAYAIRRLPYAPTHAFNGEEDYESIGGPWFVTETIAKELSARLYELGQARGGVGQSHIAIYDLKLEFVSSSSQVNVYVCTSNHEFVAFMEGAVIGKGYEETEFYAWASVVLSKVSEVN